MRNNYSNGIPLVRGSGRVRKRPPKNGLHSLHPAAAVSKISTLHQKEITLFRSFIVNK